MADMERLPLVEDLADAVIEALFTRFREGRLQLPALSRRPSKKEPSPASLDLWQPGVQFDATTDYALAMGRTFDRRGSVYLEPGIGKAANLYQIRVRILSESKVDIDADQPKFKDFSREFRKAATDVVRELALQNEGDFAWLRNYAGTDGEFAHGQVKSWFEFSSAPPPHLLPVAPRNILAERQLSPGDVIFHGDEGGRQEGTLALAVEKEGRLYGLSAAHVVSLHGRAFLETDIFVRQRGASEAARRRRVGQFAAPESVVGAFKNEAHIQLDAALFSLLDRDAAVNEFELSRRWRQISAISEIAPSEQDERPPVLLVRPGYVLQVAEVAAVNAATVMLGENDCLLFYTGLLELRRVKRNTDILPSRLTPEVKNPNRVIRAGDSGSVVLALKNERWYDEQAFEAVGLIVGGNSAGNGKSLAYALPMTTAQLELDFTVSAEYK